MKMRQICLFLSAALMIMLPTSTSAQEQSNDPKVAAPNAEAATNDADAEAAPLIVGIGTSRHTKLWCGLNGSGELLVLHVIPNQPFYTTCKSRKATPEDVGSLAKLTEQGKLFEAARGYNGPIELAKRYPGFSLTRIQMWKGNRQHEVSITGLSHAPNALQIYVSEVVKLTEASPLVKPAAAVRMINLERTFGKDNTRFVDAYLRSGAEFHAWDSKMLTAEAPELVLACRYPETVEAISEKSLAWMESKYGEDFTDLLIRFKDTHLKLLIWRAVAEEPKTRGERLEQ